MRRDAAVLVAQEHLAGLERHSCRSQSAAERVLEIVDAHMFETSRRILTEALLVLPGSFLAGVLPRGVVHAVELLASIGEDVVGMLSPTCIHHRSGHRVQNDQAIFPVLDPT